MKKNITLFVVAMLVVVLMAASYKYIGYDRDGLACFLYFVGGIYLAIFFQVNVDFFCHLATRNKKKRCEKSVRRNRIPETRVSDFDIRAYFR